MRFLFTTMSPSSHLMPLIPFAHAAQAAGHEALVATSGSALRAATASGLIGIDVGTKQDVVEPYADIMHRLTTTSIASDKSEDEMLAEYGKSFGEVSARMLDELLRVADQWRADAVVYNAIHAAGLLTARIAGIPAILHGYGTPLPTFGPSLEYLAPQTRKAGLGDHIEEAEVEIDVCPSSLTDFVYLPSDLPKPGKTLPMQYTAYSQGAVQPDWALVPGERPRVVATCGSVAEMSRGGTIYREIVRGTTGLGIELVVLGAGADLPELPKPLPDHVRLVDWMSLRELLTASDAIVHHGGSGTVLTSLAMGMPQVSIPLPGTINVNNAQSVAARGAGRTIDMASITADAVTEAVGDVLRNASYRESSQEVAAEMAAMPAPSEVVGQVEDLIGR